MRKILIITGGRIEKEWAQTFLEGRSYDCVIAVDRGYEYAENLGVTPDVVLGDFDSINEDILKKIPTEKLIKFPPEKDHTDTELALSLAIEKKPREIDVLGAFGTREDHAINSFLNMLKVASEGIVCHIYDKNNKVTFLDSDSNVTDRLIIEKTEQYGDFLTIIPLSQSINISLTGVKYPLHKEDVLFGSSLCQSNEITYDIATVELFKGKAAVFESKD